MRKKLLISLLLIFLIVDSFAQGSGRLENILAASSFSYKGLGCVVLQKQSIDGLDYPTLQQKDFLRENTIYVITYDFVLTENVVIPANCILKFEGGSINGSFSIIGQNTRIEAGMATLFGTDITLKGSWNEYSWNICWFGASASEKDNSPYIKKALDVVYSLGTNISNGYGYNDCGIFIPSGKFNVASQIIVDSRLNINGNGTSSIIYSRYKGNLFEIKGVRGTVSLNNVNFICDDSVRTSCNCLTLNTEQGTAIGRITNCDFSNFNIALDLYKPYWLRVTSCNFIYSNEYAIKAKNANSFSLVNCNFRTLDGKSASANHLYFMGDLQGVCFTGCDFSGAYKSSIKLEKVNGYGVQITGNYFEPGFGAICAGGLIEANNCNITDLLFRANAAYESGAFDSSIKNRPRYFILLRNSSLYRSDVVANVIIDGTLKGNSNSLVGRIYKYSDFILGKQNLIDQYFSMIDQARQSRSNKDLNSKIKELDQCFSEIQKMMVDNSIINSTIIKERDVNNVFYRVQNVESAEGSVDGVIKSGPYNSRPSTKDIYDGFQFYNTDTHKTITWGGGKWWNPDGTEAKE